MGAMTRAESRRAGSGVSFGALGANLIAFARACAVFLLTAAMYTILLGGAILFLPFRKTGIRWRRAIVARWAHLTSAIIGMKLNVDGIPPCPPFLLVSNHLSYVDVLAYASQLGCVFIARNDVAKWPAIGPITRAAETIFVDRSRRHDVARVSRLLRQALLRGDGVMLFAEGSSSEGAAVLPFNSALLGGAAAEGLPVHHAAITYRTPEGVQPANLSVCWWGDMTFTPHLIGLLRLPAFEAKIVFGRTPITGDDRKTLAADLRRAVEAEFAPVVGATEG
jgi:1-acyl-sn-glycerol-3-phosphate acyltransferase